MVVIKEALTYVSNPDKIVKKRWKEHITVSFKMLRLYWSIGSWKCLPRVPRSSSICLFISFPNRSRICKWECRTWALFARDGSGRYKTGIWWRSSFLRRFLQFWIQKERVYSTHQILWMQKYNPIERKAGENILHNRKSVLKISPSDPTLLVSNPTLFPAFSETTAQ